MSLAALDLVLRGLATSHPMEAYPGGCCESADAMVAPVELGHLRGLLFPSLKTTRSGSPADVNQRVRMLPRGDAELLGRFAADHGLPAACDPTSVACALKRIIDVDESLSLLLRMVRPDGRYRVAERAAGGPMSSLAGPAGRDASSEACAQRGIIDALVTQFVREGRDSNKFAHFLELADVVLRRVSHAESEPEELVVLLLTACLCGPDGYARELDDAFAGEGADRVSLTGAATQLGRGSAHYDDLLGFSRVAGVTWALQEIGFDMGPNDGYSSVGADHELRDGDVVSVGRAALPDDFPQTTAAIVTPLTKGCISRRHVVVGRDASGGAIRAVCVSKGSDVLVLRGMCSLDGHKPEFIYIGPGHDRGEATLLPGDLLVLSPTRSSETGAFVPDGSEAAFRVKVFR